MPHRPRTVTEAEGGREHSHSDRHSHIDHAVAPALTGIRPGKKPGQARTGRTGMKGALMVRLMVSAGAAHAADVAVSYMGWMRLSVGPGVGTTGLGVSTAGSGTRLYRPVR